MMAKKLITAVVGFKPEPKKDKLILKVKNAGNQTQEIEIHSATLAPLAASIMAAMSMFPDEPGAKQFLSQPLTLTGIEPVFGLTVITSSRRDLALHRMQDALGHSTHGPLALSLERIGARP